MIEVTLHHLKPFEIMAIIAELRQAGYKQNQDFDFTYFPAYADIEKSIDRHTIFTFYNEELATFFALKYSVNL